jgi:hypothetical protein
LYEISQKCGIADDRRMKRRRVKYLASLAEHYRLVDQERGHDHTHSLGSVLQLFSPPLEVDEAA